MNTEKIREAAQSIYDGASIPKNVDTILAELDKAQSAKVLTDEAVKDEAVKRYGPALYKPGDPRHDMQSVIVFYSCYEWLRDNGYLAPSPRIEKLTEEFVVARAMEIYHPDEVNDGHPWYGHRRSIEDCAARHMVRHLYRLGYLSTAPPVDIERIMEVVGEFFNWSEAEKGAKLRTRLTNALTPKP